MTDFGARGDGQSDDSPAFGRALGELARTGQGVLHVPPGNFRLASRVSVKTSATGLMIRGDGLGVSKILCDNAEGAIRIEEDRCLGTITICDLSLCAVRADAGTALDIVSPSRGVRDRRNLIVRDVEMRGEGTPTQFFFNRGLNAENQWRPLFHNVIFAGVLDPALKKTADPWSDDSLLLRPEYGIQANFCYAPVFQHCYAWSVHTGYRMVSPDKPEGPEDAAFYRCNAVGCRVGMDIKTQECEPQLVIDSCHLNCRDVGIRLENRKFFQITKNLLYCETAHQYPYTDISLSGLCYAGLIAGNIFHYPTKENLLPSPPAPAVDRAMIRVGGKCRDLLIRDGIYNAKGTALVVEEGAANVVVKDNLYPNRQTQVRPQDR